MSESTNIGPRGPQCKDWRGAPEHPREAERLAALRETGLVGGLPDPLQEAVVRLASQICGTPISAVSLVDADRQWFSGIHGLPVRETPREQAFCAHAILQDVPLVVPDATKDDRFAWNPLVTGAPGIRFYAGVRLLTADQLPFGSLCVIDSKPRTLSPEQIESLRTLAGLVASHLELHRRSQQLQEAERGAHALADRFTKIASLVPGMIYQFRLRPDGTLCLPYVSGGIRQLYNLSPEEVREDASAIFKMIHPDDLPRLMASIGESASTLTQWECEYRTFADDGATKWWLGRAMPEREADGGTLWHGSVTDITAAKQTQSELREMTERFQLAAQAGGVGTWDWDIGAGRLIWDDQMYRVYGLSREARTESFAKWSASKHPDDKASCDLEIKLALQGEKPFDTQFRIVRPDGAIRVIRAIASVQRDTLGKPVRMIGTNWDVTAETEAAEALRRAQRSAEAAHEAQHEIAERLKKIASRVPGMIYQYRQRADGSSCFPYASEGIRNIYNVSPEEVREDASPVFATLHPDDVPGVVDSIRSSHETLTEWRHEYRVRRPDGSERWLLGNAIPEREADGGTLWHGSITDMTAKKESELALSDANRELNAARIAAEAASRAKSAFLANMSHEIRTPLTAILGFADLLRDDGNIAAAPEQRVQAIDTIRSAGTHLLTLINDILDLSKIEADKMTVERIEMSPLTVLSEVRELLNPKARGKGIELRLTLASPVPERMMGDPTRLRQVLMNLVGNAVKFTEAGMVSIIVSTEHSGAACRLAIDVEDTGPGMDPAQTGQLFQPFGQADDSVTRRFGGTGLGLTVSRRLAALMGGDVSLIRTELGRGSCFRLTLPLEAASTCRMVSTLQDAEQPTVPAEVAITLTGHMLLVEDGPDNQRLIAFHLRKAGASVDIAENGQVALERLEKAAAANKPYDLVLTDMQMPVMDGYTLASAIRRRGSAVPIVALTAHAMAEDRERCIAAGCDDFATKPIDRVALLKTCKRWLDTSGAEGARSQAA